MMQMKALLYYRSKLDAHDQSVYDSLVSQWMHFESHIHLPVPHCNLSEIAQAIHFDFVLCKLLPDCVFEKYIWDEYPWGLSIYQIGGGDASSKM